MYFWQVRQWAQLTIVTIQHRVRDPHHVGYLHQIPWGMKVCVLSSAILLASRNLYFTLVRFYRNARQHTNTLLTTLLHKLYLYSDIALRICRSVFTCVRFKIAESLSQVTPSYTNSSQNNYHSASTNIQSISFFIYLCRVVGTWV